LVLWTKRDLIPGVAGESRKAQGDGNITSHGKGCKSGASGEEEDKCMAVGALREEMPRRTGSPPETETKFTRGTIDLTIRLGSDEVIIPQSEEEAHRGMLTGNGAAGFIGGKTLKDG